MRRSRVILLVHSQDENRVTLQVVLKREGYVVLEATDASSALEQIRESVPDLVITEMRLPRASGGELIRTIRSDSSYPRLRVLAVGDESARADAEAAGADGFQIVPATPKNLIKAVVNLIGRA
ncbi:MAG: response regulator [Gemmatimonadota bacterium]